MKRPRTASLDEVRITRDGDCAVIEFADATVSTTNFKLGPSIDVGSLTDAQILDHFNDAMRGRDQAMSEYEHVAIEIPPGKPQIQYFERSDQWTPRGDVLRCVVSDGGPEGEATVYIDDRELSLREFGRLLTTYAGWGMRIAFVP